MPNESDAYDRLAAQLSPAQRVLLAQAETDASNQAADDQAMLVDMICRHFPGLEPAVRAIASIAHGDLAGGNCACWPKSSPPE